MSAASSHRLHARPVRGSWGRHLHRRRHATGPGARDLLRFALVVGLVSLVSKPAALLLGLAWGFRLMQRGALADDVSLQSAPMPPPAPPDPVAALVGRAGDDPHRPANLRQAEDALAELDAAERRAREPRMEQR